MTFPFPFFCPIFTPEDTAFAHIKSGSGLGAAQVITIGTPPDAPNVRSVVVVLMVPNQSASKTAGPTPALNVTMNGVAMTLLKYQQVKALASSGLNDYHHYFVYAANAPTGTQITLAETVVATIPWCYSVYTTTNLDIASINASAIGNTAVTIACPAEGVVIAQAMFTLTGLNTVGTIGGLDMQYQTPAYLNGYATAAKRFAAAQAALALTWSGGRTFNKRSLFAFSLRKKVVV